MSHLSDLFASSDLPTTVRFNGYVLCERTRLVSKSTDTGDADAPWAANFYEEGARWVGAVCFPTWREALDCAINDAELCAQVEGRYSGTAVVAAMQGPIKAETDPVVEYLDRLEQMDPSPRMKAIIAELRADRIEADHG